MSLHRKIGNIFFLSLFILPEDLQNIPGNLSGKPMEIFGQMV